MFMFNKNNALPGSRQSSVDSLVTDPSTSTSTSDAWISQSSGTSSYGELPSPEDREHLHSAKRNSVFNLRSRSNTATSTTPSMTSLSSSMMSASHSKRFSQDYRHLPGQSFMDGGKRSLFTRSRRGRRSSGQFAVEENEEADFSMKRSSVLRKSRRGQNPPESPAQALKHRISSPFGFQHLTHTDRQQFAALEQASDNDLVAEFRAVRASQAPRRGLTGIKADDLHFRNFSSENLAAQEPRAATSLGFRSPPGSPGSSQNWREQDSPVQDGKGIRMSRSVESFSQPGVRPRTHRHTQSANPPPPRVSSRLALTRIEDLPEEPADAPASAPPDLPASKRQSGIWDMFSPLTSPAYSEKLATIADDPTSLGYAVTTPDDSAIQPLTPPFSPALEDVQEEERFVSPRPAPRPPLRSPMSPFSESFSFRGTQRSSIARSNSRTSSYTSPKTAGQRNTMTRPLSQMSDTLGAPASPTYTRRSSIRRSPPARRKSNTWRVIEECWEDDVDFIYDNALEADCDFDWDRNSEDGYFEDRDRTPEQQDHKRSTSISDDEPTLQTKFFPGAFRPSLLVPSPYSVPELESRSALSASTTDTGLQTPSDIFDSVHSRKHMSNEPEGFSLTPSLLVPSEFKEHVPHEEMYNDILADYEGSDRHYPLIDASQSVSSSSRSSHVRSSKRSSYDSSLMSSGQTSGSWSSPARRSASSAGSLPELVHSRRARRDFNLMVDQLSEQVASIESFDEGDMVDDNDTTPPGRPSQDRTFFASQAGSHPAAPDFRASIEGEVRASLELARQGSTRSSRTPAQHHKYASSEGTAQLLGQQQPAAEKQRPKSRSRATSSSNVVRGNKQAYLSLFPTPPKTPLSPLHSPRV
ncbi:hypothetical protein EJ04DRAFT_138509 [Polyplosphaeria fusca]|uniref:CRIB domain-containing protein n=1 Tax=Polyplosphaeria fusca TaxID=682080 RepID=A0A9P4V1Z5_9PLEO|nr:hypothetical protein EJ04DRAFT_138509 [Polyplosphaeria fusca]